MLSRFGELGLGGTRGLLTVGEAGRAGSLGTPDTAAAPSEGVTGGLTNNRRADTSTTARKQEGGREGGREDTGCSWETRLSSNRNTLKAPPTLMTSSVQSSLNSAAAG